MVFCYNLELMQSMLNFEQETAVVVSITLANMVLTLL